ncbi:ABC transporter ATP-binding protein [Mangrovihabitans endophyticus]|uniref:ABC transporter ATP-binding protein n=1 Tax=Mangrovihabitans endophyticus TaxID=1751298 RepID=A0A8J3C2I7_9ACTN|nr:ABC transporter ATP-binding protein [Mangrovihabitans endophyticus]GGL09420.1 ABC transporter ATP-binding protein [Mangrovihabitans endophyticus]
MNEALDHVMLRTRGLVSGYGRLETLHGVDVDVPAGGVTTIIGPNGSGKSTFLKTVAGLVRTWRGETLLAGEDVAGEPAHALVRRGMCLVPQGRVVFPLLTVEENLRMCAFTVSSASMVRERIAQAYEFLPVLADRRRQPAGTLSGGEQAMLAIAKVIMLRPRVLLLDEPSLGLSPKMIDLVYEKVRALAGQGLTTLIVEQNVRKALAVAGRAVVLVLGTVRYAGPVDQMKAEVDLGRLFVEGEG